MTSSTAWTGALALAVALAEEGGETRPAAAPLRGVVEVGAEHLAPTLAHRQIHTSTLDLGAGIELFPRAPLVLLAGLNASLARGEITQLDENFRDQRLASDAASFGLGVTLRFEAYRGRRLSVGPELAGSLQLHDRSFPAGGDVYNFMWRLGGALGVRLRDDMALYLRGRWTHVSNGQGLGPRNPAYEGAGVGIGFALWTAPAWGPRSPRRARSDAPRPSSRTVP